MKSLYHGTAAANAKLRGKKTRKLSCGCCVVFNLKQEILDKEERKETQREIKDNQS